MNDQNLQGKQLASYCCKVIKCSMIDYRRAGRAAKRNAATAISLDAMDELELSYDGIKADSQ